MQVEQTPSRGWLAGSTELRQLANDRTNCIPQCAVPLTASEPRVSSSGRLRQRGVRETHQAPGRSSPWAASISTTSGYAHGRRGCVRALSLLERCLVLRRRDRRGAGHGGHGHPDAHRDGAVEQHTALGQGTWRPAEAAAFRGKHTDADGKVGGGRRGSGRPCHRHHPGPEEGELPIKRGAGV